MPRPDSLSSAAVIDGPFIDSYSRVEMAGLRYNGATVEITGLTARISGPGFDDTYILQGPPEYDLSSYRSGSGSVVGMYANEPFVVIRDIGCQCRGSSKMAK